MPTRRAAADATDAWALAEIVTRLRRVLRSSVRSEYPWERLPMAQVEILQRLADEPGLRVSELAARHRLAANTVSNLIQQMVQSGLVERREDVRDRRAVTVQLTPAGAEQLAGWQDANGRRLAAALHDLSAADRGVIHQSLPALARLVDSLEGSG
jgi:DNA-binding MarR family transcriptional regulator